MAIDKHVSQFYNNDWFIYDGQEVSGPVNFSNLLEWFYTNDDTQNLSYYVCQEGMSSWQKLKDTIDLHNKLQQFSVEDEKNKFIEQLESQLKKINNEIKDSISVSNLYSINDNSVNNLDLDLKEKQEQEQEQYSVDDQKALNEFHSNALVKDEPSSVDTLSNEAISSLKENEKHFQQEHVQNLQQKNQDLSSIKEDIEEYEAEYEYKNEEETSNESIESIPLEHRTHQILKNSSKTRTYKKSLKVPPLSSDMELTILTNRLRLGTKRSPILSALIFPVLTCGIYFLYWLCITQLELTKFLNKKNSSLLLICSFIPLLNILSIYHILSLNKGLNKNTTNKTSRLILLVQSVLIFLVLPVYVYVFQKRLNTYWKDSIETETSLLRST